MAKRKKPISFDFSGLSFDLGLTTDMEDNEREFIKSARLNFTPVTFENALEMAKQMDLSRDYFAFVSGKFIFGDFIEALLLVYNLRPTSVYITTLGMSENNVDSLVNLVDYLGAEKVNLIVSGYFASVERRKLIPYMVREFEGKPIDVAVLASHSKICLIESTDTNLIITGSANLSSSNNVEQFHLFHDEELFQWLKNRLDTIMEKWTVIRGSTGKTIFENNTKNLSRQVFEVVRRD